MSGTPPSPRSGRGSGTSPAEPADLPPLPGGSIWRTRPGLLVRLRSHLKAVELDEALAAGADPLAGEQILWRARQLTEPSRRVGIAATVEGIVEEVRHDGPQMLPGPQLIRRDVIKANRSLLRILAERLRGDAPLALRGLAMVELLVHDGNSPLYRGPSSRQLRCNLLEVLAALDPLGS